MSGPSTLPLLSLLLVRLQNGTEKPMHFESVYFFSKPLTTRYISAIPHAYLLHSPLGASRPRDLCSKYDSALIACSNYYILKRSGNVHIPSHYYML